jgi:hypothetical protein
VKTLFAYDGTGSISDTKLYALDTTYTYQFVLENTYQYDLNVNPLKLGFESFLINDPTRFSSYNLINAQFIDQTNPANTYGYAETYIYNTVNKPKTGSVLYGGNTGASLVTYYYE